MSDQKQARIAGHPPSLNRTPGRSNADIEKEEITRQFREAIERFCRLSAKSESGALFLYWKLCRARVEENKRKKAGTKGQSAQSKQLQNIASAAKRLHGYIKDARGLVFDAWASVEDVDRHTATQEWLQLKYLVEITARRATKAKRRRVRAERTDGGRPGDAMARVMSEAAASVYTELTGKPIDQGIKGGSFDEFLTRIFDVCEIKAKSQYWTRQLIV